MFGTRFLSPPKTLVYFDMWTVLKCVAAYARSQGFYAWIILLKLYFLHVFRKIQWYNVVVFIVEFFFSFFLSFYSFICLYIFFICLLCSMVSWMHDCMICFSLGFINNQRLLQMQFRVAIVVFPFLYHFTLIFAVHLHIVSCFFLLSCLLFSLFFSLSLLLKLLYREVLCFRSLYSHWWHLSSFSICLKDIGWLGCKEIFCTRYKGVRIRVWFLNVLNLLPIE